MKYKYKLKIPNNFLKLRTFNQIKLNVPTMDGLGWETFVKRFRSSKKIGIFKMIVQYG